MEKAKLIQSQLKSIFGDAPVNLVGGSVRDIVLNREPKDWDYCTPLTPDEIEDVVRKAGRRPYLTGKRFGTIGFKIPSDFYQSQNPKEWVYVEVTTYRAEKYDGKSRKPQVEFIDELDADLSRRDFTINAMVLQEDGGIYDPHGGRLDILARQIKTVGTPKDRITEDPLRMLRAARFASQLNFGVDPNLTGKMRQLGYTIVIVSKERWVQELDKMLMGQKPERGIKLLMQSDVMKYILPEVYLALQDEELYYNLASAFEQVKDDVTLNERWAMLLHYVAHPHTIKEEKDRITFVNHEIVRAEMVDGICSRLKFSNERRDALLNDKKIYNKTLDLQ
jgi:poly(A) polymerase